MSPSPTPPDPQTTLGYYTLEQPMYTVVAVLSYAGEIVRDSQENKAIGLTAANITDLVGKGYSEIPKNNAFPFNFAKDGSNLPFVSSTDIPEETAFNDYSFGECSVVMG